jgi:putative phosphoribosyl transferase
MPRSRSGSRAGSARRRGPGGTLGAVSEGGAAAIEEDLIAELDLSRLEIDSQVAREGAACDQLGALLRGRAPLPLSGRSVLLVDDGVQSGTTIRAVTRSVRAHRPARLILAVPVGATDVLDELRPEFDHVICLEAEPMLGAIGARYRDFWRVSEAEVASLLADRERAQTGGLAAPTP